MPLPHFLSLIFGVIAAAGLTILLAVWLDIPLVWLGLAAVVAALAVRGLKWR